MKKRFAIGLCFAAVGLFGWRTYVRWHNARLVFGSFIAALKTDDYELAQSYVAPGILEQTDNGDWVVHMVNGDVDASEFSRARIVSVRRSFRRDIVVFTLRSRGDMAHVESGVITHIKCP